MSSRQEILLHPQTPGGRLVSELNLDPRAGSRSQGPLVRRTGDLERGAADAIRPIIDHALKELGLGPAVVEPLVRRIAEAYMTGRAVGINLFPHTVDRALSAEGIAIAFALEYGPGRLHPR